MMDVGDLRQNLLAVACAFGCDAVNGWAATAKKRVEETKINFMNVGLVNANHCLFCQKFMFVGFIVYEWPEGDSKKRSSSSSKSSSSILPEQDSAVRLLFREQGGRVCLSCHSDMACRGTLSMLVKGMDCCKMRSVSDEVLDQLTAHFLFLITNDLDGPDVAKLHKPGLVPCEADADPLTITSIINKCRIHKPVC